MPQVITRCPLTGHYMYMGIDMNAERFAALPEPFARKFCPYCACEHDWYKRDTKFADLRPAARKDVLRAI